MIHFGEIRTDYIETEEDTDFQYVDTWMTDDDWEEGHSVAKVNLTTGEVIWTDTNKDIISNPEIILALAEIIYKSRMHISER